MGVVDFKANKSMLLKILFLVIFIQVICGKEEATLGEFPWTVSLRLSGFVGHDCGGAILNSTWILTTGYCAQLNDDLDHGINGEDSEQIRHVEKAFVHPYFSPELSSD